VTKILQIAKRNSKALEGEETPRQKYVAFYATTTLPNLIAFQREEYAYLLHFIWFSDNGSCLSFFIQVVYFLGTALLNILY
jgi:hypothetical protein